MTEFRSAKEVFWLIIISTLVFTYLFVGLIRMGGFNEERERREQMCQLSDIRLIESEMIGCEIVAKAIDK